MHSIAITGQSNAQNLRDVVVSGLTPAANTFMLDQGVWVPPVNSLIAFANELIFHTGKPVYIIPNAVVGTLIAETINSLGNSAWWLNKTDPNSPLRKFLATLTGNVDLQAMWWIQGETEATNGATKEKYVSALLEFHSIVAGAIGKTPDKLPFMISPIGAAAALPYGRFVTAAQYSVEKFPGMFVGPEYWDLPTDSTGIHLTGSGYVSLATRGGNALAKILYPNRLQQAIWSANLTVNSAGWDGYSVRQLITNIDCGGTVLRVIFKAPSAGQVSRADHCSIGILGSATFPNMMTSPPIELKFRGVSGFNLAPGTSITSDWIEMPFAPTDAIVIDVDFSASGADAAQSTSISNGQTAFKAAAADWNNASVSGYLASGSLAVAVSRIEIPG